jgi:hypothetical protein
LSLGRRKNLSDAKRTFFWLADGKPEGRDKEHWAEAERLVDRIEEARDADKAGFGAEDSSTAEAKMGPGCRQCR